MLSDTSSASHVENFSAPNVEATAGRPHTAPTGRRGDRIP